MSASSSLFRRHRNRDADSGGQVTPSSSSRAGVEDGGANESSPAPAHDNQNVGVGGASSASPSPDVGSSSNDGATTSVLPIASSNQSTHASPATDDEEQELVVQVPTGHSGGNSGTPSPFVLPTIAWEPTEEAMALRREAIHREVERVQRSNFVHFLFLCLVPTTLLLIVIAAIISEDGECSNGEDGLTLCEREPRTFVNAFTSRCICDAVKILAPDQSVAGAEEENTGGV